MAKTAPPLLFITGRIVCLVGLVMCLSSPVCGAWGIVIGQPSSPLASASYFGLPTQQFGVIGRLRPSVWYSLLWRRELISDGVYLKRLVKGHTHNRIGGSVNDCSHYDNRWSAPDISWGDEDYEIPHLSLLPCVSSIWITGTVRFSGQNQPIQCPRNVHRGYPRADHEQERHP